MSNLCSIVYLSYHQQNGIILFVKIVTPYMFLDDSIIKQCKNIGFIKNCSKYSLLILFTIAVCSELKYLLINILCPCAPAKASSLSPFAIQKHPKLKKEKKFSGFLNVTCLIFSNCNKSA